MNSRWLQWAKRLQAVSQTGLYYAKDPFDVERYEEIRLIAAEMIAAGSDVPIETCLQLFSSQDGYATPKVDVRGVIFREGKILLVKERSDGGWTLPGGWADVGETPRECVEKEVLQESGFEARAVKLLAVWDRERDPEAPLLPFSIYKLFFLCEIVGGEPKSSYETEAIEFYAEDEIPPLSLTRTTTRQIHRLFEHDRHRDLPCDFE